MGPTCSMHNLMVFTIKRMDHSLSISLATWCANIVRSSSLQIEQRTIILCFFTHLNLTLQKKCDGGDITPVTWRHIIGSLFLTGFILAQRLHDEGGFVFKNPLPGFEQCSTGLSPWLMSLISITLPC